MVHAMATQWRQNCSSRTIAGRRKCELLQAAATSFAPEPMVTAHVTASVPAIAAVPKTFPPTRLSTNLRVSKKESKAPRLALASTAGGAVGKSLASKCRGGDAVKCPSRQMPVAVPVANGQTLSDGGKHPTLAFDLSARNGETRARGFLPLWYALPTLGEFDCAREEAGACMAKTRAFATVVPGQRGWGGAALKRRGGDFTFTSEHEYYLAYARSFFAVTRAKAGLDCLRHYEILASGAVPFWLDIDALHRSPLSMYAFPRRLMLEAMKLPGVPSQHDVEAALANSSSGPLLDWTRFPLERYCQIRKQLIDHTRHKLTTLALAKYVLGQHDHVLGKSSSTSRVLLMSSRAVSGATWMDALLYHGLRTLLGDNMSALLGRKDALYADYPAGSHLYGRGFTYARRLPPSLAHQQHSKPCADKLLRDELEGRLQAGFYELVIVTSCGMHDRRACDGPSGCYGAQALSTVNKYLTDYPAVSVVTVDGNDLYGSCPDPYPRLQAQLARRIALHFVREVDADRKVTARWVRPPDLSARGSISELA